MGEIMQVTLLLVALAACLVGKICGMGGGVIIKPVIDSFGIFQVDTINYLSGFTVFGMCCCSVCRSFIKHESQIILKISTPLAIGAAIGGIFGKNMFSLLQQLAAEPGKVGSIQAFLLFSLNLLTLFYTINKDKFPVFHVDSLVISLLIGTILGAIGSFLGIGGGPVNLAVLYLFYSMSAKEAAENSLYIIFISQGSGLLKTLISSQIPDVSPVILSGMIIFGILGGELGGKLNSRLSERKIMFLFKCTMILILGINIYNVVSYSFLQE